MNPAPHQKKLPEGYSLSRTPILQGRAVWEVHHNATGRAIVTGQKNPKIAVERALKYIPSK